MQTMIVSIVKIVSLACVVALVLVGGPARGQDTGLPLAPPPIPTEAQTDSPTYQPRRWSSAPPSAPTRDPYLAPPAEEPGSAQSFSPWTQSTAPAPRPLSSEPPVVIPPPVYGGPPPVVLLPTPIESPRFWLHSEYLIWWTKNAPLPTPLVTVGSDSDAIPGALGQPGTQVIYGGHSVDLGAASGLRLESGIWIDANQHFGIEASFFALLRQSAGFSAFSDDNGFPVLARPVINANTMNESSYVDALPGAVSGGVIISHDSQFYGWEINGLTKLVQSGPFRLDGILGFRYLNLTESLEVDDQLTSLAPGALTFPGQTVNPGDTVLDFDRFQTTNNFYGGQLGARMTWDLGRWTIDATSKVAIGTTQEKAIIRGGSALFPSGGGSAFANGGVLATSANIGDYYQSPFAVSPEFDLNCKFHLTPNVAIRLGYTFLYWSNVLRPGDQVSRVASPTLVPTDQNFGSGGPNLPLYQFQTASYWAQGLNIGLDFQF